MKMPDDKFLIVGGIVAVVAIYVVAKKVKDSVVAAGDAIGAAASKTLAAVNPMGNENIAYKGASAVTSVITTGESGKPLGVSIYDWLHPASNVNANAARFAPRASLVAPVATGKFADKAVAVVDAVDKQDPESTYGITFATNGIMDSPTFSADNNAFAVDPPADDSFSGLFIGQPDMVTLSRETGSIEHGGSLADSKSKKAVRKSKNLYPGGKHNITILE